MIPVAGKKPKTDESLIVTGSKSPNWRDKVREIVYPVWDDGLGCYIFDGDGKMLCQIRGWGGLTSSGVPETEAVGIQAQWGRFIADSINNHAFQQGLWDGIDNREGKTDDRSIKQ